jgi:hypothetical protein
MICPQAANIGIPLAALAARSRLSPPALPGDRAASQIQMRSDGVRGSTSSWLFFEIKIAQRLPVAVAHDEAGGVHVVDNPGRREAARRWHAIFKFRGASDQIFKVRFLASVSMWSRQARSDCCLKLALMPLARAARLLIHDFPPLDTEIPRRIEISC